MSALVDFVSHHTLRDACKCGKCIDPGDPNVYLLPHTVDMYFFNVCAVNEPKADELRKLIGTHQGEFGDCNPLDGGEHSYIELGGWIGDQGLALRLMGLGKLLGVWDVIHPRLIGIDGPLADQMAGMGMVSIYKGKAA